MAVSVVTFAGDKAEDAETAGDYNTGAAVTDAFYEGTQSVGVKTSAALGRFYSSALAGGVAGSYDFSSGGADEGEHIFAMFNALTPTDSFRIIVGEQNATTDAVAEWDVGPPAGYSGGWQNHVANPANDFSRLIAAGTPAWTTTGNVAQLTNVDIAGQALNMTTMISGNFANALVDTVSIGLGYRITNGDGVSADAVFADFVTYESNTSNAYGAMSAKFGILFPLCGYFIGFASGAGDTEFTDDGFVIVWPNSDTEGTGPVATGFYQIQAEQGSGTTDIVWSNGSFQSEADQVDLNLAGVNGVTITQTNISTNGGLINLDGSCSWDGGTLTGMGVVDLGGAPTLANLLILDSAGISTVSSDAAAMVINATTEIANVSALTFDGAGLGGTTQDAAIEVDIAGAGPFTLDFNNYIFQNKVTGSVHVHILQNSDANYTINVTNGGTGLIAADVTNDGTGSVTLPSSEPVTITCLNEAGDPLEGIVVRVEEDPGGTLIDDGTTNGSGVFTFSYTDAVPQAAKVIVRLKGYKPATAFGTIASGGGLTQGFTMIPDPIVNLP